jgi:hypothetical protein
VDRRSIVTRGETSPIRGTTIFAIRVTAKRAQHPIIFRMSETTIEVGFEVDKELQVISWRREQLVRAALAFEGAIDLHAAVELRRSGCPSGTAVRILL